MGIAKKSENAVGSANSKGLRSGFVAEQRRSCASHRQVNTTPQNVFCVRGAQSINNPRVSRQKLWATGSLTSRGESDGESGKHSRVFDASNDLVLTPREGNAEQMSEAESAPTPIALNGTPKSFSTDRSVSEERTSYYKPPSIEERLSLIMEARSRRLEEMGEKLLFEKANNIAPRPKVLTRRNNGRLKALAICQDNNHGNNHHAPLLLQQQPLVDFTSNESFGSSNIKSTSSDDVLMVCERPVENCLGKEVRNEKVLKSPIYETPMEIDKED